MSMVKRLVQFGEFQFSDEGWTCETRLADTRGQYQASVITIDRAGSTPYLVGGQMTPRVIPAKFRSSAPLDAMSDPISMLMGRLMTDDPTPRRLVGVDGARNRLQIMAIVSPATSWNVGSGPQIVDVTFTSGDVRWESTTDLSVVGPKISNYGQWPALCIPNPGRAIAYPYVVLTPETSAHWQNSATVGFQCRRQCTFTNASRTWTNRPLRLDFGDTRSWITSDGAKSDGTDVRVQLDGVDLPRTLSRWNTRQTWCWITPPPIAPGETVTFDILYANPSAGAPATLTGKLHPQILYEDDGGTATGGTTLSLSDSTKTWTLNNINWRGAFIRFQTGANANQVREITSQTTTSVSWVGALTAPSAGDEYQITHSRNSRHYYNTGRFFAARNTPVHGRWYEDQSINQPHDIDHDVPSSWRPFLMADNSDRFAQKSTTNWQATGNWYSLLNAYRTWEGGGPNGQITDEDGIADGVMLASALPILKIYSDYDLEFDLNAMAQAVVMIKPDGAEGWELLDANTANGAVTKDLTLPVTNSYYFVYQGLLPSDDEGVIRPDRARDSGRTSSAGNTRTTVTAASGTQELKKDPSSSADPVLDPSDTPVGIDQSVAVERDGRRSGGWRGILYTEGTNDYRGWAPLTYLSGTDSGGTTAVDSSKDWETNSLVGAIFHITGADNEYLVGKSRTIVSNTATTLTFSSGFAATVGESVDYEIRQKPNTVRLIDNGNLWIDFDTTGISLTAASAMTPVYQHALELAVGDGGAGLFGREQTIRIGLDGVMVSCALTECLVIDAENRRAYIQNIASGAIVRTLTEPAVVAKTSHYDALNRRYVVERAAKWLPLTIGDLQGSDTTGANLVIANKDAGWTITGNTFFTNGTGGSWWSASEHYYMMIITANSGAAGSHTDIVLDYLIPFAPAARVGYMVPVRVSDVNYTTRLGINWYDSADPVAVAGGGHFLSATFADAWTFGEPDQWVPASYDAINYDPGADLYRPSNTNFRAPAGAVAAKFFVRVSDAVGGTTGTVKIGSPEHEGEGFQWGAPKIWMAEVGQYKVDMAVTLTPGFLG